ARRSIACEFPSREGQELVVGSTELALPGRCRCSRLLGHLQGRPCTDEALWSEREASTFILSIDVPYLRLQSRIDHVQPDIDHAILLVANATAEEYGGHGRSPWTRLNDLAPNRVYTVQNPPWLPVKDMNLQIRRRRLRARASCAVRAERRVAGNSPRIGDARPSVNVVQA
ncbi:MAG: hypothetical protein WCQ45_01215, partial [bacterium]